MYLIRLERYMIERYVDFILYCYDDGIYYTRSSFHRHKTLSENGEMISHKA